MTSAVPPVTAQIELPVDPTVAFQLYVTRPGRRHPEVGLSGRPAEIVYEPFAGGRWFERDADGHEHDWGRVIEWDPPHRLVLAWMVGSFAGEWRFDPDPSHASRAEITFQPKGVGTVVSVTHSGIEAHGAGAPSIERGARRGWVDDLVDLETATRRYDEPRR